MNRLRYYSQKGLRETATKHLYLTARRSVSQRYERQQIASEHPDPNSL